MASDGSSPEETTDGVVITIGGLPGSGTTTAARLLSERLGLPWTNGGEIFRALAKEKGMELNEFGRFAERNPDVDRELDRRIVEIMKRGNIILESRLAGVNAFTNHIPSLRVWLHASLDIRVNRIQNREGGDPEKLREAVRERERSERARYMNFYGFDYEDTSHYSLIVDSGRLFPDQIVERIVQWLKKEGKA